MLYTLMDSEFEEVHMKAHYFFRLFVNIYDHIRFGAKFV